MLAKYFFKKIKHDVIQLEKIKGEYYETIFQYIVFNIYLKASIALEGVFIKTSNPNTILKVIPLGSQNKTIPVDHVASVDSSFRLDFKSFAWGYHFRSYWPFNDAKFIYRRIDISGLWCINSANCF